MQGTPKPQPADYTLDLDAAPTKLVLADDHGLGSISVEMQSFFELSFWMAEELEDLVRRELLRHAPKQDRPLKRERLRP